MNSEVIVFLNNLFAESNLNRLPNQYGGHTIFRKPTIGVSAGKDPIIKKFKDVVSSNHLTPAEMWSKSASAKPDKLEKKLLGIPRPDAGTWNNLIDLAKKLNVLSIVFPYTKSIMDDGSNCSRRTLLSGLALNCAHAFHTEVYEKTTQFFIQNGFRIMVPQKSRFYSVLLKFYKPYILSVWSERHYAFAAGLGTFGLAQHFITDHGSNIRLASFITDAPLEITPRFNNDPYANCLHFSKGGCAKCVDRCPGNALTKDSFNKVKCEIYRQWVTLHLRSQLKPFLKPLKRSFMYFPVKEYPIGCGVCQYNIPCMDKNPMTNSKPGN